MEINLYTVLVEGTRLLLAAYAAYVGITLGRLWCGRESSRVSYVFLGVIGIFAYLIWAVLHNGVTEFLLDDFFRIAMLDIAIFVILKGTKILAEFEAECQEFASGGECPVCGNKRGE